MTAPARLVGGWLIAVTVLLMLRPVHAANLWWHLARGREVFAGTLSPSRGLLVLDQAGEADWLSGAPFYFIWSLGGIYALAAIPVLAAVVLLFFFASRITSVGELWKFVAFFPWLVWTVREDLQPVPELFDLLGLVATWAVLQADCTARARLGRIFFVFLLWGNLAPRPVWGLLLLGPFSRPGAFRWKVLAAAVLGGMITPRGVLTWWDSCVLFAPAAFVGVGELGEPNWRSIFVEQPRDASQLAFVCLWAYGVLFGALRRPDLLQVVRWIVPLLAVVACRGNLAPAGMWVGLDLLTSSTPTLSKGRLVNRQRALASALIVSLLVLFDAAGRGWEPYARLGCGIAAEIDPRLLDDRFFAERREPLPAWAPDGRSVGIIAWMGSGLVCVDHPQRALLGRRWPVHAGLIQDLMSNRGPRYRRADDTWGGWMKPLSEWEVWLLFVPAEWEAMHQGLVESPWRPADLDSVSVPYALANDPHFADVLEELVQQRWLVETGPWRPTLDIYSAGGWRFDLVEALGLGPDTSPAVRQSRLFRALNLPVASLRVLRPVMEQTAGVRLQREFTACQNHLAYNEWNQSGQASEFRRRVLAALPPAAQGKTAPEWTKPVPDGAGEPRWRRSIERYLQGDRPGAVEALQATDGQQHYAAALMFLEEGRPRQALDELEKIPTSPERADKALSIMTDDWKAEIGAPPDN